MSTAGAAMRPPVYSTLAADTDCQTLLTGSDGRLRVYPFGEAPQQTARAYVVWQIVYGGPDNSLSCVPNSDLWGVQFDMYGPTADAVLDVAAAVRGAVEPVAPVVRYGPQTKESGGGNSRVYRYSFDVDWRALRP
jgi:hypothetical protein